ncbi:hypothetical protein HanIR_Chr04g0182211 [Helianthus annuus]|nr:hypothetical protein HanIR_Chr04g0182211 [Helianthus annuus]
MVSVKPDISFCSCLTSSFALSSFSFSCSFSASSFSTSFLEPPFFLKLINF